MTCTHYLAIIIIIIIFRNFPNTTRRFTARGILDNFEISLVVLLPNTTTSHAITYTKIAFISQCGRLPKMLMAPVTADSVHTLHVLGAEKGSLL